MLHMYLYVEFWLRDCLASTIGSNCQGGILTVDSYFVDGFLPVFTRSANVHCDFLGNNSVCWSSWI